MLFLQDFLYFCGLNYQLCQIYLNLSVLIIPSWMLHFFLDDKEHSHSKCQMPNVSIFLVFKSKISTSSEIVKVNYCKKFASAILHVELHCS